MSEEIEDHRLLNPSSNEPFASILERRVSRRSVMRGGLGMAAASMLGGFGLTACGGDDDDGDSAGGETGGALALAFTALGGSQQDAVVVPEGYTAQVVMPWGTPINMAGADWRPQLNFTPDIQANSVGMHHDGMHSFALSDDTASSDFIMALNNEYIDQDALWAPQGGPTSDEEGSRPADEVRTEINAHGVTIVQLRKQQDGTWELLRGSPYNRRITSATPMDLSGPVAGSRYAVTAYDTAGTSTRGTNNNCANGFTAWGTYLTCEENWPNVFRKSAGREPDDNRLGMPVEATRYGWETPAGDPTELDGEFARFNATPTGRSASQDYRNEPRTFGYIVEIDPYSGESRPVKRTALGRFRHEGCWPGKLVEGEPVVFYSGHDSRNEYIYKFVSDALWRKTDANMPGGRYDRLAIGDKYLNSGTLYAAKFHADGTGEWLKLAPNAMVPGTGQTLADALGLEPGDLAGVIINTCDAADIMGATPMDRPEWGTVDPVSGAVYMTLTNNSDRTADGTEPTFSSDAGAIGELGAGYATAPVNAANPRVNNSDGQVIRWREASVAATSFEWDIFVFGKLPGSEDENLSGLTEQNFFSSCDGLWYDERGDGQGILWIQTDTGAAPEDGDGADFTNDQVLAIVPQGLEKGGNAAMVNAANQTQLKRFAIGPNDCEVTGIFATPDKTALFINIQHPGNWPADPNANSQPATVETAGSVRPRASTVVIQKIDGGPIAV